MKRIAYLSTLADLRGGNTDSECLMEMYNTSRVFNREHDITGVFIVCQSHILQVFEGGAQILASAVYKISRDGAYQNNVVVDARDISSPMFQGWTIRFISGDAKSHLNFMRRLEYALGGRVAGPASDPRLTCFFDSATPQGREQIPPQGREQIPPQAPEPALQSASNHTPSFYQNSVLSLSRWPKPSQLKLSHELIKLCSRLVGKPVLFERLSMTGVCASEEALVGHLNSLESLGLLRTHRKVVDATAADAKLTVGNASVAPSTRFSDVLRRFLSTPKA